VINPTTLPQGVGLKVKERYWAQGDRRCGVKDQNTGSLVLRGKDRLRVKDGKEQLRQGDRNLTKEDRGC